MKTLVAITALSLVAGCTPSTQSAFEKLCAGLTAGYAIFSEVREVAKPTAAALVDTTWQQTEPLCINPPKDPTSAGVRIAAASLIIWKAYREAR